VCKAVVRRSECEATKLEKRYAQRKGHGLEKRKHHYLDVGMGNRNETIEDISRYGELMCGGEKDSGASFWRGKVDRYFFLAGTPLPVTYDNNIIIMKTIFPA
jgi:hypothetical protein